MLSTLLMMTTLTAAAPIDQTDTLIHRSTAPVVMAMSGKPPKCETVIEIDENGKAHATVKCTF